MFSPDGTLISASAALHCGTSLSSLEKPSASAISITPDEINSTASNTLLACGHTQKGNLIYIDAKKQDTRFSVCVFNAQSVGPRDKRTEIVEFICDECVDIRFLTETWMRTPWRRSQVCRPHTSGLQFEVLPPCYTWRWAGCYTKRQLPCHHNNLISLCSLVI